jgi:hypothetical protein
MVRGSNLTPSQRTEVLQAFIYRWTRDNRRRAEVYGRCPVCGVLGGEPEPTLQRPDRLGCRQHHPVISLQSDAEWLASYRFPITKAGNLAMRRHIEPYYAERAHAAIATKEDK